MVRRAAAGRITPVDVDLFEHLKRFVRFDDADAAQLRALAPVLEPRLAEVAQRFLQAARGDPRAQELLARAETGAALQQALQTWLRGLCTGAFDPNYAQESARIGRAHVRVGVPQHLMLAGLELLWQELVGAVSGLSLPDPAAKLAALHKPLMIAAALMLESHRESHTAEIRQSEREAVQDRLREAEQLAQVGQLAASLAHEIKNPLAGISGAVQVIRASLKPTDPHYPVLGEVLRQINRLDRSVKDLLVYARPKPPQFQRCDLARTLERVLTLLRKEPEFERVRFESDVASRLPLLAADENQLEQLLVNLLLNAAQASAPGGAVRLTAADNARGVKLTVQDHGCGMSAEVLRRAMEPFFTTKARGTGLGLPICRKIVEAHGGRIALRSAPGVGTEVLVELPEKPPAATLGAADEHPRSDR